MAGRTQGILGATIGAMLLTLSGSGAAQQPATPLRPDQARFLKLYGEQVLPKLPKAPRRFFFDLADPEKRTADDLRGVLTVIGRFDPITTFGTVWHTSGVTSVDDAKSRDVFMSASSAIGAAAFIPWTLNRLIGTRFSARSPSTAGAAAALAGAEDLAAFLAEPSLTAF